MMVMKNELKNSLGYSVFRPRAIDFHGIRLFKDTQFKVYSVIYGTKPMKWKVFEEGFTFACNFIPSPPLPTSNPGLGFLIAHQGLTGDYIILCWWARENELPTKVFLREKNEWRPAKEEESFCVWDLEIIWYERETYISTILSDEDSNVIEQYLSQALKIHI